MGKPNLKIVSRHGVSQPEGERARKQVLLRLPKDIDEELTRFAKKNGWPKSYLVEAAMRLVMVHWEDTVDTLGGPTIGDIIAEELSEIEE